jgi:hypothetical protein
MSEIKNIDDKVVELVLQLLPNVNCLTLLRNPKISDDSLRYILIHEKRFKILRFGGTEWDFNTNITYDGLE